MAAHPKSATVECSTIDGRVIAAVEITTNKHFLAQLTPQDAAIFGEEPIQIQERGRYEYRLIPASSNSPNLTLLQQRGVQPSNFSEGEARGLIEPGDYCGQFPLIVVQRDDPEQLPVARGNVEVRSIKLGARDHYRGMLSFIAEKCAGLLLDSRSSTRLRLDTLWQDNPLILEQQLEFLRYTLESYRFQTALDEVLRNPHRQLENNREERNISRPFKPDKNFSRQVAISTQRTAVPTSHPLYPTIKSLPSTISVRSRVDFLDTAENRFVKMVLLEFRDFLAAISVHLGKGNDSGTERLKRESDRLRGMLETQLSRGFLPDVAPPIALPLGSPVLQRRSGYREMLRIWLQFHAGAQLVWDGGEDVFTAGARNVATLYEYWLFFQLETLFRKRFSCEEPLHAVIVNKKKTPHHLELKRGVELKTPVNGVWSDRTGRRLMAEFHFNKKFTVDKDRSVTGSWTRGVQPDYTISIWPAEYLKEEAEKNELMVHIHFDAKYRVERMGELLGEDLDDREFQETDSVDAREKHSAAKYSDLLKMHAYRDAIRRTAGAYVLYPGDMNDSKQFTGFHEILPGLGAFSMVPDQNGQAHGLGNISNFLDQVIDHLANRTTARERVSYHVSETYTLKESPVSYDTAPLAETDIYGPDYRALPPAEEMVLVAWYQNQAQLEFSQRSNGLTFVRLGRRRGALRVHPNFSKIRRVLLHTHDGYFAPGLLDLTETGFRVFTRTQLRAEFAKSGAQGIAVWQESTGDNDEEFIYAVYETTLDTSWAMQEWDGNKLLDLIEKFESDARNKPVEPIGRRSPYPRVLPLQDVLKARK